MWRVIPTLAIDDELVANKNLEVFGLVASVPFGAVGRQYQGLGLVSWTRTVLGPSTTMKTDIDLTDLNLFRVKCGALHAQWRHVLARSRSGFAFTRARRVVLGAALGILTVPCDAQDALFHNLESDQNTQRLRRSVENLPYTVRWGDLRVLASPSLGLEFTDNYRLADEDPESDVVLTPNLALHATHPIGEANLFSVDVGIGYSKYIDHSDMDRLLVTPGTAVSLDMAVGSWAFNIHNRLTYELDPVLAGPLSQTGSFGGIDNTAGILSTWLLRDAVVNFGYDHVLFLSSSKEYDYLDRTSHQFLSRAGVKVLPELTLGLEGTVSPTEYDRDVLNDSIAYSVGAYGEWVVTETLRLTPRAGYSIYSFSENGAGYAPDSVTGFYFGIGLNHRPNEIVSYQLNVRRQTRLGYNANLLESLSVELDSNWSLIRNLPLHAGLFFEDGKELDGPFADEYVRYGGNLAADYQLTEKATVSLIYSAVLKDSVVTGRDYLQNRVSLVFNYRF